MKNFKNDFKLISVFILIAVIGISVLYCIPSSDKSVAVIEVNGTEVAVLDLNEDIEYSVESENGTNLVKITDKKVCVIYADCPDILCVKQGYISKNGQSIICLPHKMVVSIKNDSNSEVDAVADGGQR